MVPSPEQLQPLPGVTHLAEAAVGRDAASVPWHLECSKVGPSGTDSVVSAALRALEVEMEQQWKCQAPCPTRPQHPHTWGAQEVAQCDGDFTAC